MADNVAITAGAGTNISTDDVGGAHIQQVKLVSGAANSAAVVATDARGYYVDPRTLVIRTQVTPTVSTSPAYTAKDAVGGLLTFANSVRASGGTCRLDNVQVVDKSQQRPDLELVLFDRTFTAPTDNSVFAPTDAELLTCVGVVYIGGWSDLSTNSVADVPYGREIVLNGTDLFGALVTRSTPTFVATTDIVVTLTIVQD